MSNEQRHRGEVIKFEFGWGFVLDHETQESVFCHHSNIDAEGFRMLHPLDQVSFEVGEGKNGRKQALNVRVEKES